MPDPRPRSPERSSQPFTSIFLVMCLKDSLPQALHFPGFPYQAPACGRTPSHNEMLPPSLLHPCLPCACWNSGVAVYSPAPDSVSCVISLQQAHSGTHNALCNISGIFLYIQGGKRDTQQLCHSPETSARKLHPGRKAGTWHTPRQ